MLSISGVARNQVWYEQPLFYNVIRLARVLGQWQKFDKYHLQYLIKLNKVFA